MRLDCMHIGSFNIRFLERMTHCLLGCGKLISDARSVMLTLSRRRRLAAIRNGLLLISGEDAGSCTVAHGRAVEQS